MRTNLARDLQAQLLRLQQVDNATSKAADAIVDDAQSRAAKDTGAGAASIHKERTGPARWGVSWDRAHDYMRFPEFGTEDMPATPALRAAADAPSRRNQ